MKTIRRLLFFGFETRLPQRQLVIGYLIHVVVGTVLLCLPCSVQHPASVINHLFTAVSALSTTGLSTLDVSSTYSTFGQCVILVLIQMGGMGYMTLTSFIMLGLTHHLGKNANSIFLSQFALTKQIGIRTMMRNIVLFTLFFEVLGTLLLYLAFSFHGTPHALWSALFHSVSAFCTAGFSIYPDNLTAFRTDWVVNATINLLSFMGAMGFILLTDLARWLRNRHHRITFTTRVILVITFGLALFTTLHLYLFEPGLQCLPFGERLSGAFFHAVSAMTTSGFNTIDVSHMLPVSLFVLTLTMYIGASPSGTGGGLKSTTLSAIYAYTRCRLSMRTPTTLMGNIIPTFRIENAITTFIFYTFMLLAGVYALVLTEGPDVPFIHILFESASALATTGLSSGVSSNATTIGKCVLIVLMFAGRVGVVTFGTALISHSSHKDSTKHNDLAI